MRRGSSKTSGTAINVVAELAITKELTDIPRIPGGSEARIVPLDVFDNSKSQATFGAGGRTRQLPVPGRWNAPVCRHQGAPLPSSSAAFRPPKPGHAGAGGARSRAISDKISANICRGTATSAIWNVT